MKLRNLLFSLGLLAPVCLACDGGDDSGTDTANNTTGSETTGGETDTETAGPDTTDTGSQSACAIDGTPIFGGNGEGAAMINGPFQEVSWGAESFTCGGECAGEPYVLLQIVEANRAPGTYQVGIDVKVSVKTCAGDTVSIEDGSIEIMANDDSCFGAVISGASVTDGHDVNGALWAAVCN